MKRSTPWSAMRRLVVLFLALAALLPCPARAGQYKNFGVAIYVRAQEVEQMSSTAYLESNWNRISKQLKVDKIYLETSRNRSMVSSGTLIKAKQFFEGKGVKVSGGIGYTVQESNGFESYCYTNPADRAYVRKLAEHTARIFDEVILDDFYFYNTKTESDIAAKGAKSWTQFRLETMKEVSENLVVKPAKAVNPKVTMIIKYPNWYEHFAGLGYNLEDEPKIFDKIYTGTETRDPLGDQHLQQYHGYSIVRYFENIKPGGNGGGWVDPGGSRGNMDRYAEQLWLTLFAKAPEVTLFDWRQVLGPVSPGDRSRWDSDQTSFNFDKVMQPIPQAEGTPITQILIAHAAGSVFEQVDQFLGQLGKPVGVKSYKPYHSSGEDHLQSFMGMIGVPMEMVPEFPSDAPMVFLTEEARFDPQIVEKIRKQVAGGKNVLLTARLLAALQDRGLKEIAEVENTGNKIMIRDFGRGGRGGFGGGRGGAAPAAAPTPAPAPNPGMLFPELRFFTNDSWQIIGANTTNTGYPLLISSDYLKGKMYVLAIPEDAGDLYNLPTQVLGQIRGVLCGDMFVRLANAPAFVSLFAYDNNTFIVESFLNEATRVSVTLKPGLTKVRDLISEQEFSAAGGGFGGGRGFGGGGRRGGGGGGASVEVPIPPHSYRVFVAQ